MIVSIIFGITLAGISCGIERNVKKLAGLRRFLYVAKFGDVVLELTPDSYMQF